MTAPRPDDAELLRRIKDDLPALRALLVRSNDEWGYEDPIYRYYHHSFKVFGLQNQTEEIVAALRNLLPRRELNPWFLEIVTQGTGRVFSLDQNADWPRNTRPILEAFFHARYFLETVQRSHGQGVTSGRTVLFETLNGQGVRKARLLEVGAAPAVRFASAVHSARNLKRQ